MKELLTPGMTTENGVNKRQGMKSNIVDTLRRYFRDDKGKMGDLELAIMGSIQKYFEEPPSKHPA